MLEECVAVSPVRDSEGITSFFESCKEAGLGKTASYSAFVMGKDSKGVQIPVKEHLTRGGTLSRLTDAWLATWEENY